jgi:hypothetical protein
MTTKDTTPKAHHATIARARLFACELVFCPADDRADAGWELRHTAEDGGTLISADRFPTAKEACALLADANPDDEEWVDGITWLEADEPENGDDKPENGDGEDDDGIFTKCGVMAKSKHDEYENNPHGPGCGDNVDIAMRDAYTSPANGLDRDAIKACAGQLWNPRYEMLNNGMTRMNVANKIRGFLRNNQDAVWTIGEHTGRFAVAYDPAKRRAKK